ncbi:MAG: hypothetical protein FWH43_06835 [Endomicrobia bacterium]|nr:hypothetical protein [Endomicrobiia bacterium]
MNKIKEFFLKLRESNADENIVIDEEKHTKNSSDMINENIRRYNKLLAEIEKIRRDIYALVPAFDRAAGEFMKFVSNPKEIEDVEESLNPKKPQSSDLTLRKREFEEKTQNLRRVFDKISELRNSEIGKYFEAKRLINNNSIVIGERKREIEITDPEETTDRTNRNKR